MAATLHALYFGAGSIISLDVSRIIASLTHKEAAAVFDMLVELFPMLSNVSFGDNALPMTQFPRALQLINPSTCRHFSIANIGTEVDHLVRRH